MTIARSSTTTQPTAIFPCADSRSPTSVRVRMSTTVLEIAKSVGLDTDALANALEDPALKERAKREVDAAIAAGVFGSPFFIVDGEPFWGVDRLPMLEQWVAKGGW